MQSLQASIVRYGKYTLYQTSVSETIRKPPLVKAQTALKTQNNKIWRKRFSIWRMEFLILSLMNVFIYLRAVLHIKLGPVISATNRRIFWGGFSANCKFFRRFMATLQNSASRLKFGGLGIYCYRATRYPSALLRSA